MTKVELTNRLLQLIVILAGVSFITFALMYIAPGDPATAMFAASGTSPSEEMLERARKSMGLDKPFLEQYFIWLSNCFSGNFGESFSKSLPVIELLTQKLWPTIKLTLLSLLLMLTVSIPLGMLSALKKDKAADKIIQFITFAGISMPGFWIGLILLYVCALKLKLLPIMASGTGFDRLILPAMTLAISMSAKYIRQVRAAVLEELNQDYVTGARARGLHGRTILWKHILPNSMLPLITLLGISFGSLLGGTAVVEVVFGYPGLGNLAVSAVSARDYPLIQGFVLWMALIYLVINLLVDISYSLINPQIRARRLLK